MRSQFAAWSQLHAGRTRDGADDIRAARSRAPAPDMRHLLDAGRGDRRRHRAAGPPARSRSSRPTRRARRTRRPADLPARGARPRSAAADLQREVEQFLYRQAELLDAKHWQAWIDLFADDGIYWMPARAEQTEWESSPSIFIEDKLMMEIRKGRVTHPNAWSQAPLWETNHLVSHVAIESVDGEPHRRALALPHDGAAARRDPPLRRPLPAHAGARRRRRAADPAAARRPVQRAGTVRLRAADLGLKQEGFDTMLFECSIGGSAGALRRCSPRASRQRRAAPPTRSRSASSARCRGRRRRSASTSATASCSRSSSNGGKLGGLPAEVLVSDDQFKPDVAKQLFEKNIKRDKVDFMTGVVFSNIMLAALPEALDNKTIYISPNAAPSSMAGKDCNPLFFAVSWPNDAYHEAAGQYANSARPEERLPDRAQLPGRQGFARRLQAHLQGPGRRRELHQARPARLRRRARRDPRRQAAGALHLPARRHGHQLHQAVRRRRPRQGHARCCCPASRPTRT